MTLKAINRLFIVVGLALFLLLGVALPMRIVQAASSMAVEVKAPEVVLLTATPSPTMTVFTSTPFGTVTPATPTESPDAISVTLTVSATEIVTPTDTPTPTPTETPTPTSTPLPTDVPTLPPADTVTPTITPSPTLTSIPPTALPEPSPTPTPAPSFIDLEAIQDALGDNWPLVAGGCLVLFIFALAVLFVALAFRRKKPQPGPGPGPGPSPVAPPPLQPEAAPEAYLESVGTAGAPRRFTLKPGGTSIGRAPDNEVVITQEFSDWDTISRNHARVYQQAGHWIVQDLGSTNGVRVNGKRTGLNLLQDGWQLHIGSVEFVFHVGVGEGAQ